MGGAVIWLRSELIAGAKRIREEEGERMEIKRGGKQGVC